MARGLQGVMMRGFGARDHEVTVLGKERLAPHFLRIRMVSPTVFEDVVADPTVVAAVLVPRPGRVGDTEFQRAYTIVEADPEPGTSRSTWCCTNRPVRRRPGRAPCEPGATIAVM